MKSKNKLLSLIVAGLLIASLGGCATGGNSTSGTSTGDTSTGGTSTGGTSTGDTSTGGTSTDNGSSSETEASELAQRAEAVVGKAEATPTEIPNNATQITGKITIDEPGDYYVNSEIQGKKITVDCEGVHLYLQGATLSNEKKVIESNYALTITLFGENSISNSNTDGSNAIDCAGGLTINGNGALTLSSTKNGIKAKSIAIFGATLRVDSDKDGLHAEIDDYDNAETEPTPSYDDGGYVYISGASVTIDCADDGIQADTFVYITDESVINIKAGGGAPTTITETTSDNTNGKGIKAGAIDWGADSTELEWSDYLVCITSGEITVDSNDDAIHSNGNVEILGGNYTLSTGDDGVHADNNLLVKDGTITVKKSYEGLEGMNVIIGGGQISLTATDDGINAAGGADSSGGWGDMPGQGPGGQGPGGQGPGGWNPSGSRTAVAYEQTQTTDEKPYIDISGGKIEIFAAGDGIDANGNIFISGGELYVSGPNNGADSAIDFDNSATITGGIVVAACQYSHMASNFGNASTQGSMYLCTSASAKGEVSLKDASGNILVSYTPTKSYSSVVVSCPKLTKGETYSVSACGKTFSVTMSSLLYNKNF